MPSLPIIRLPKNKAEEAELHALSTEGPYEVYKWIYGPEHFFTQSVLGQSWQSLRVSDPSTGAREIVDSLKQLKRSRLDWAEFVRICFMAFTTLLFIGELIVTKYLPDRGLTFWYSTLSFTVGMTLLVFVTCAAATYVFLRVYK